MINRAPHSPKPLSRQFLFIDVSTQPVILSLLRQKSVVLVITHKLLGL